MDFLRALGFGGAVRDFSAVVFDMDGVLVDSEPLHQRSFETLFEQLGLGDDHGIDFADYYGRSDKTLLEDFIAKHKPPQSLAELWERKLEIYLAMLREQRPIFPDARPLIPRLAARYPLALASSSKRRAIDTVLEIAGFAPHFRAIVSLDDVRAPKPDPEIYSLAAKRLDIAPQDCVVVEDAAAGVQAAKSAGMSVIAITTSLPAEKLAQADFIVRTHRELGEMLLANGL